jgi:hypothetical protein
MIFTSIGTGLARVSRVKRAIVVYYLVNLLFGLAVAYPLSVALRNFAGNSLMSRSLLGGIDADFLFEFIRYNNGALSVTSGIIVAAAILYAFVGLFLSGGAFSILTVSERYKPATFWSNAGRFFGRFVRLGLWSIPAFIVFYLLQFIVPLLVRVFFGSDPYQYITYWSAIVRTGVGYIGILLYYMVMDYGRIYTVLTDERSMRRALWRGVRFTFGHLGNTLGISALLFVLGACVLVLYNLVANPLESSGAILLLVLILVQQLYVFFRMWLKLTLYASEVALYESLAPVKAEPVPPPELSIAPPTP